MIKDSIKIQASGLYGEVNGDVFHMPELNICSHIKFWWQSRSTKKGNKHIVFTGKKRYEHMTIVDNTK